MKKTATVLILLVGCKPADYINRLPCGVECIGDLGGAEVDDAYPESDTTNPKPWPQNPGQP